MKKFIITDIQTDNVEKVHIEEVEEEERAKTGAKTGEVDNDLSILQEEEQIL